MKHCNQYICKHKKQVNTFRGGMSLLAFSIVMIGLYDLQITFHPTTIGAQDNRVSLISPVAIPAESMRVVVSTPAATLTPTPTPTDDISQTDSLTGQVIDEFYTQPGERSHMRKLMHCLLYKEAKHNYSKGHGDSGLAGGPLQFHQGTWNGYRKIMIAEGKATEIGSRYDLKEALRTAVWAIKDGRGNAWGPISRGECN